jgi:hypothetical protein
MPRPKKIKTPDDLDNLIDEFIALCENSGMIPSDYQLTKFLDISPATLDRYYNARDNYNADKGQDNIYKGFDVPLKKLIQYREDRLLQQLEGNPKLTAGAIFQLKQAHSGGYVDRPVNDNSNATVDITVKLDGLDKG